LHSIKQNYKIFILFFVQLVIIGIASNIVGPLIPILSDYFQVNLSLLGFTSSLNAFGILIISIFSGFLSERFGKRRLLIIGNIIFVFSFLGLFFSKSYLFFTICYLIFGFSWGIVYINSVSIINDFYKNNKTKIIILLNLGWMFGTLIGPLFVSGALYFNLNWRYLFIMVIIINLILLFVIIFFKIVYFKYDKKSDFLNILKANKNFFKNRVFIYCGIIIFFQFGIGNIFQTWLTTYLIKFNIVLQYSSLILSIYMLFFCLGMIFKSFLANKLNEKKIILLFSIFSFIFLICSLIIQQMFIKIIFILLFGFSISAISTTALSISIKNNIKFPSFTTSIMTSFGYLGVVIFQYSVGYLIGRFSYDYLLIFSVAVLLLLILFSILLNIHKNFV
jgi:MFS family permease